MTISIGKEQHVYEDCWIIIDHENREVHIWTDPSDAHPSITALFVATLIEWKKPK